MHKRSRQQWKQALFKKTVPLFFSPCQMSALIVALFATFFVLSIKVRRQVFFFVVLTCWFACRPLGEHAFLSFFLALKVCRTSWKEGTTNYLKECVLLYTMYIIPGLERETHKIQASSGLLRHSTLVQGTATKSDFSSSYVHINYYWRRFWHPRN